MGESLNVDLSDDAFAALRRSAEAAGTTPGQLAAQALEQSFAGSSAPQPAAADGFGREAARERFERHFGSLDLGHATGADNDRIDADLAREYAAKHEKE